MARGLAIPLDIERIEVTTEAQARELGAVGSPTVRVDGLDIDPAARAVDTFGFT